MTLNIFILTLDIYQLVYHAIIYNKYNILYNTVLLNFCNSRMNIY